jgi:hypothetical protein
MEGFRITRLHIFLCLTCGANYEGNDSEKAKIFAEEHTSMGHRINLKLE